MTGSDLMVVAKGGANLVLSAAEVRELAAALDDRDRLEWLEQAPLDAEGLINLVGKWTWGGKRHAEGLRAAIDAAKGKV